MEEKTFLPWKDFIHLHITKLRKALKPELFEWISSLEFISVLKNQGEDFTSIWYHFKATPIVKGIEGFIIDKDEEMDELWVIPFAQIESVWEGITKKEVDTLVELFNSYDFESLYEHFLYLEREKEVIEWKEQLKGQQIVDLMQGKNGNLSFFLEDEKGQSSAVTIHIPYAERNIKYHIRNFVKEDF
jgi:hypothetical protein